MIYLLIETIDLLLDNILITTQNRLANEKVRLTEEDMKKLYVTRFLMGAEILKGAALFAFLGYECMEKSILTTFVNFQKEIPLN